MSRRAHISMKTKLAAALLARGDVDYDKAKAMGEKEFIRLYEWDHTILHSIEPIDEYWNLTPKLIAEHREKSRRDTAIVAHVRRVTKKHEEFRERLLARDRGEPKPLSRWPKQKLRRGR